MQSWQSSDQVTPASTAADCASRRARLQRELSVAAAGLQGEFRPLPNLTGAARWRRPICDHGRVTAARRFSDLNNRK